jgi:hypothetical protein
MSNKLANLKIAYSLNIIYNPQIKKSIGHDLSSGETFLLTKSALS